MRAAALGMLATLASCGTPEEYHFRTIGRVQCKMQRECEPDVFATRFESVDACIDESEIGVQLYAEACRDFDGRNATACRRFMRTARRTCTLDTSDARYEDYCLEVCSNYQGSVDDDGF